MCDHHHLRAIPSLGDVEHVSHLSDDLAALFMQDDYSDITLIIEGQRFSAHKVLLAARSEYFRALLYGGLRESLPGCEEIELKETSAEAFRYLLKYVYSGRISLTELKEEVLLEVLGLAHRYGFILLEAAISDYLKAALNNRNVCLIYDIASIYSLQELAAHCCDYMDRHATDILHGDAFMSLSPNALRDVLARDSFCAPEADIFRAVRSWAEKNPEHDAMAIMKKVRLPLINLKDLLTNVRGSGLVSPDAILDAIKVQEERRNMELNYRGFLTPEENVATLRHSAQVITGEMKAALLDGDSTSYDLDRGFTRHPIDDNNGQGIIIKLGQAAIINTVRLLLWDRDMRSYSYYVEVSMDGEDWISVVDHRRYLCRSWQYLRFPPKVIKFVKVVGCHNSVNRVFHLVSFECLYSRKQIELSDGITVPRDNVATIEASAWVIEGVSRSRNALINGDTKNYDWDSGYTCHQLGSGAITVQLAQPYIIGSMRLLLWDCDGRSYSYRVEVSTDQQQWTVVADKTREACRSWQTLSFERRPVTFVRIVGTHNTANEVFHCVHFECPAESNALSEYEATHPTPNQGMSMPPAPDTQSPRVPRTTPADPPADAPAARPPAAPHAELQHGEPLFAAAPNQAHGVAQGMDGHQPQADIPPPPPPPPLHPGMAVDGGDGYAIGGLGDAAAENNAGAARCSSPALSS